MVPQTFLVRAGVSEGEERRRKGGGGGAGKVSFKMLKKRTKVMGSSASCKLTQHKDVSSFILKFSIMSLA